MTIRAAETSQVNGFDTGTLGRLARFLETNRELGRVEFSGSSRWQEGARVFTSFRGYRIDGQTHHQNERAFVMLGDEPSEFGASDTAPAPVEMLLHALANCITATTNAYAALSGVELTRLEVELDALVDLHGMFGLDQAVRPGLQSLTARVEIAGNADGETLRGLVEKGVRFSPVRDTLASGVSVEVSSESGA